MPLAVISAADVPQLCLTADREMQGHWGADRRREAKAFLSYFLPALFQLQLL